MSETEQQGEPGAAARDRVLGAAREVFAECGYYRATLAAVAERAGVGEADLDRAYGSTAALLRDALDSRDDRQAAAAQMFDEPGGLEVLHTLKDLVRDNLGRRVEVRLHAMIAAEATDPDHPAHPWAQQRYQWQRSLFAAAIRRDIDAGRIRTRCDPQQMAAHLVAMMDGLQLQWLIVPDETAVAELFDAYIDGLIAVITRPVSSHEPDRQV